MARLFIAAWPDRRAAEPLAAIVGPPEPGVRWAPPANWHITLRFIGEADVDAVTERLRAVALRRVVARLGPTVELFGPRQAVVPVEGVDALATAVRATTYGIGTPDRHRFGGHLTIARLRPGTLPSVLGARFSAEFTIVEIALVGSELHADGAIYTTLARFPTT